LAAKVDLLSNEESERKGVATNEDVIEESEVWEGIAESCPIVGLFAVNAMDWGF